MSLCTDSKPRNTTFIKSQHETSDATDVTIQWDVPSLDLDDYLIEYFLVTITTRGKLPVAEDKKYFGKGNTTYYAGPYNLKSTGSYDVAVKTFYEDVEDNYKLNTSDQSEIEINLGN